MVGNVSHTSTTYPEHEHNNTFFKQESGTVRHNGNMTKACLQHILNINGNISHTGIKSINMFKTGE